MELRSFLMTALEGVNGKLTRSSRFTHGTTATGTQRIEGWVSPSEKGKNSELRWKSKIFLGLPTSKR